MPRSPYAASKAGGDRLAYAYFATYGLPVVVTRCSNNYGPRQYPEKLVPLFVTNAIDDEPLPVYGTGRNRRDWITWTITAPRSIRCSRIPGSRARRSTSARSTNSTCSRSPTRILRLLGKPGTLIRHVEDRPGHDRRYAVDSSKLSRLTGWKPATSFADGIRRPWSGTARM